MIMQFGWKHLSLDVKNAFSNASISEELYAAQPEEFVKQRIDDRVLLLRKALYGLEQTSKEWYVYIDSFLKEVCCEKSHADPAMYFRKFGDKFLFLVV